MYSYVHFGQDLNLLHIYMVHQVKKSPKYVSLGKDNLDKEIDFFYKKRISLIKQDVIIS